jgi:hypothetical protein
MLQVIASCSNQLWLNISFSIYFFWAVNPVRRLEDMDRVDTSGFPEELLKALAIVLMFHTLHTSPALFLVNNVNLETLPYVR